MTEHLATTIEVAVAAYAGLGCLFAPFFVTRGAGRLDASAQTLPWRVRLLIVPGAVLLWPVLTARWAGRHGAHER